MRVWRSAVPDRKPPLSFRRGRGFSFSKTPHAPDETRGAFPHTDQESPSGKPVLARPGRYLLKGTASDDGRFVSDDVEIIVRRLRGTNVGAYEVLRTNNIHHFFIEFTIHRYEYDRKTN